MSHLGQKCALVCRAWGERRPEAGWVGWQGYSWCVLFQKQEEGTQLCVSPRPSPEPFGFSCSRNKPSGAGGLGWAEVMAWAPCSSAEPPQPSGEPCPLQCWASPGERSTTPPHPPQPQRSFLPGLLPPVSGLSSFHFPYSKTSVKYPISSCPVSFSCAQIRL